jgi:hypothetical protein
MYWWNGTQGIFWVSCKNFFICDILPYDLASAWAKKHLCLWPQMPAWFQDVTALVTAMGEWLFTVWQADVILWWQYLWPILIQKLRSEGLTGSSFLTPCGSEFTPELSSVDVEKRLLNHIFTQSQLFRLLLYTDLTWPPRSTCFHVTLTPLKS